MQFLLTLLTTIFLPIAFGGYDSSQIVTSQTIYEDHSYVILTSDGQRFAGCINPSPCSDVVHSQEIDPIASFTVELDLDAKSNSDYGIFYTTTNDGSFGWYVKDADGVERGFYWRGDGTVITHYNDNETSRTTIRCIVGAACDGGWSLLQFVSATITSNDAHMIGKDPGVLTLHYRDIDIDKPYILTDNVAPSQG